MSLVDVPAWSPDDGGRRPLFGKPLEVLTGMGLGVVLQRFQVADNLRPEAQFPVDPFLNLRGQRVRGFE